VAFLALVRRLAPSPALPAGTGVTLRYVALSGVVFYYLTGDGVVAAVAVLGLLLLFLGRPSRLREG